jgi:lysophospholipase L1-like esterase
VSMRRLCCVAAGLVALIAVSTASSASTNAGPPTSIAAIGDSITTGACTDATCADRPQNSWSTGSNPAVRSHFLRLRAIRKGKVEIKRFNLASSGSATMADLASQASEAVRDRAAYATVELGENDLCGGTKPAVFRAELERGLNLLSRRRIPVKVLLLSIENEAAHWRALRDDPKAATALRAGATIDCGLGYTATNSLLSKVETRARLLNGILAAVCSEHPDCLYDGGTYFRLPLKASDYSSADYQHLSIEGQRALAAAEWKVALKIIYF